MPHKRAKKSVRTGQQVGKGYDLAPTNTQFDTGVAKRAAWVLDAEKVRREFREKQKRARDDGGQGDMGKRDSKSVKKRKKTVEGEDTLPHTILPGESLSHFNKRVEADFRPSVRAATKSSAKTTRQPKNGATSSATSTKVSHSEHETQPSANPSKAVRDPRARKTEFESRPVMTRLNDVAMAPPTLRRATRNAPAKSPGSASALGLSMAQRAAMEAEREMAIRRYRELKEAKRIEAEEQKARG